MTLSPKKKYFLPGAAAVLLLGAIWIFLSAAPGLSAGHKLPPAPQVGFPAPDFTLPLLEGGSMQLSALAGQPVLINFWASWCAPCRAEMPAIQRVADRFSEAGFTVLAVNVTSQDSLEAASAFVTSHGLRFPILLDTDGTVAALYENRALPSTFFIDRDGLIREIVIGGPMSEVLITTRVTELLEGDQP